VRSFAAFTATLKAHSVATDVRGHPVSDRPVAGAAGAGMRGQREQRRQATTAKVRLDTGQSARFSVSVPSSPAAICFLPALGAILPLPKPVKGTTLPRNRRESGECRVMPLHRAAVGAKGRGERGGNVT
jgi:hypothetical protein